MRAVLTMLALVAATAAAQKFAPQPYTRKALSQSAQGTVDAMEIGAMKYAYEAYGPYFAWNESPAMDIKPVRTGRVGPREDRMAHAFTIDTSV